MSVNDEHDLKGIVAASQVAKHLREFLREQCQPGSTTAQLDDLCRQELRALGAVSAPRKTYGAPCFAFYSVNACVVHGLPSARELQPGDLVKIDVTPEYQGFVADTACSVVVGGSALNSFAARLAESAERSFQAALDQCRVGGAVNRLGRAIENSTRASGFFVVPDLAGHGVGRAIHEEPSVLNVFDPSQTDRLSEGLVIAIEPMICSRKTTIRTLSDRWTITAGSATLTAHHEHTVLITRTGPVVLTA